MNQPVILTKSIVDEPGQGRFVRLEWRDKLRILGRLEMSLEDDSVSGLGTPVTARLCEGAEG